MKEELDKQLCEKYPKIFAQRHLPASQTPMHWGIAIGDGWYDLIDVLCHSIQSYTDQQHERVRRNIEHREIRNAALAGDWSLFEKHYSHLYSVRKTSLCFDLIKDAEKYAAFIEENKRRVLKEPPPWFNEFEPIEQVEAVQVKEKFGGLRFYHDGGNEYIHGLVAMAEMMSYRVCEQCGAPGKLRDDRRWVVTLCDEHAQGSER